MQIDENFLRDVGLSAMPEPEKRDFLAYVQEELEVRIGERIARGLTKQQLQEFDNLTDQQQITAWLEKNRPDYRRIITRTIEELKDAIRANRASLLS